MRGDDTEIGYCQVFEGVVYMGYILEPLLAPSLHVPFYLPPHC